jgi:hypothetical protein
MDDRMDTDEVLESGLRHLPAIQASSDFQDRVMASIHCRSLPVWDLALLGKPMALGASLSLLTLALGMFAWELWLELDSAGTLVFANLLLLDAQARADHFSSLLAAFWDSFPLVTVFIVLVLLALYVVPIRALSNLSGAGMAFGEAGRN